MTDNPLCQVFGSVRRTIPIYKEAAWLLDDAKEYLRDAYRQDDPTGSLDAIRRHLKLIGECLNQIDGGDMTLAEQEAMIADNASFRGKQP